jgi:hypothetical protein
LNTLAYSTAVSKPRFRLKQLFGESLEVSREMQKSLFFALPSGRLPAFTN